jgi:translation initiation factor 3 subunit E
MSLKSLPEWSAKIERVASREHNTVCEIEASLSEMELLHGELSDDTLLLMANSDDELAQLKALRSQALKTILSLTDKFDQMRFISAEGEENDAAAAAAATPNSARGNGNDLTSRLTPFLDRHMVFPLLDFVESRGIYDRDDVLRAKLALLEKTNMVDFAVDVYGSLHEETKKSGGDDGDDKSMFAEKRAKVIATMKALEQEASALLAVVDGEDEESGDSTLWKLNSEGLLNWQHLKENFDGVTEASLDAMFRYAKFQYECGVYSKAARYLRVFRMLSTDVARNFSALWGEFAADILMQDWDAAYAAIAHLRKLIDGGSVSRSPAEQLEQRTWLMHWALFVFFNHPDGRNGIVDLFFQDRYLNAIQTSAPHLLRYFAAAAITNKRRRNVLQDLVTVLKQEHYAYRDPITEFVEALYLHFDFDGAQLKLAECEAVLVNDFFLCACADEFIQNARLFIFETYCRIHRCIDIAMLADKLRLEPADAERWIVNLIRNARLDAKIDSAHNQVVMGSHSPSVYQRVIERTKVLSARTYVLSNHLLADEQSKQQQEQEQEEQEQKEEQGKTDKQIVEEQQAAAASSLSSS